MANLEIFRKTLGSMGVNCYILVNHDTDECIVFDPGDELGTLTEIFSDPAFNLKAIFLTHGHFDHIGAVNGLKEKFGVPVYASRIEDEKILSNPSINLSSMFGFPVTVHADELLEDGQELEIIGAKIKCILTPGHTSGGMCFYIPEMESLIAGDTLFCESVGRTDFPTGSGAEIERSIREKLYVLPDNTKVFPGHMDTTTIEWEKKHNYACPA
ncbi:MAG: MBL fold metallo-hydrolase [Lachnospiraceae bacterium]|nr:MBL fold metallo-hydrolase [Lachnospiraceae bacterium]